jgi:lipopolysaccharide/colanic/teichoic acid biosynthesis glycosyltransferase
MISSSDFPVLSNISASGGSARLGNGKLKSSFFASSKRAFDLIFATLLLPLLLVICAGLLLLNPFFNPGPLFYTQKRMGQDCKPFRVYKFRSMIPTKSIARSHNCPVETDRITGIGRVMRLTRIDELPQIINVLKNDMSLIGPRPDFWDHAVAYVRTVPGYHDRHAVKPGISGLAQVRLGYIEGESATRRKARIDRFYINNSGFKLELMIFFATLAVVFGRIGAK